MSATHVSESSSLNNQRFHALDALRAYAMLAGIALHLAIYFLPFHITGSKREYTGHDAFTYFIYMTHMYRMQVFFVLAGFFARLVFRRKGYLGFAWHRFTRIVIPFAVGWVIMYPWCTLCHVWAAVDSGDILSDKPFWELVGSCIINDELAGFTLVHLWFLYSLILSYAIVVAGEWVLSVLLDRQGRLRDVVNRVFRWLMQSPLNVVWLSLPLWPLLYWMGDWFGVITPADSLWPHYAATITYTFFFLVGWLLHAQTNLLKEFEKRWVLNFVCGIAISVALFLYFEHGRSRGVITMAYPLVFDTDIRDYAVIRSAVRKTGDPELVANTRFLRDGLPPLHRQLIEDSPMLSDGQMVSWAMEVNKSCASRSEGVPAEDGGGPEGTGWPEGGSGAAWALADPDRCDHRGHTGPASLVNGGRISSRHLRRQPHGPAELPLGLCDVFWGLCSGDLADHFRFAGIVLAVLRRSQPDRAVLCRLVLLAVLDSLPDSLADQCTGG